ncbi:MAG: hypothetical protein WBQ65_23295 [Bryobacteraceae bacterium]
MKEHRTSRTGKRISSPVGKALERQLSRPEPGETAYDLALKAGLIGRSRGEAGI